MQISSNVKDYTVTSIDEVLTKRGEVFEEFAGRRLFFFVDDSISEHYGEKLRAFTEEDFCLVIRAHESEKEYRKIADYYQALIDAGCTRNDVLVTIGGGILQDISGFIASTLYRGLRWVFIPTTLLAQADSCIGSKTSINFGDSKNLVGSFYPPDRVYIDSGFCASLTDEYFNSGVGEIIKFHLLSNGEGYATLREYLSQSNLREQNLLGDITLSTLQVKKSYFEEDEFDTGRRNLLNYGHCFGHALESATDFGVCHGEAVIVGMGFANLVALKRRLMTQAKYDEFEEIFKKHYPKFDLAAISVDDIIKYMKKDKKRVGKDLVLIMGSDVGEFDKFTDVTDAGSASLF